MPFRDLPEALRTRYIEKHHIARERADNLTVPACPGCHEVLDLKQYDWPPQAQDPKSPRERRAAYLLGLASLHDERARIDKKIARRLRRFVKEDLHEGTA
jgi:hypothetical protein